MPAEFHVRSASWQNDESSLRRVRTLVFIEEQHVPPELEWDELDAQSVHFLALDESGQAIGTARLHPSGAIGRLAVLQSWRGRGVGQAIMQHVLETAKVHQLPQLSLAAQLNAIGFYERFGFVAVGTVFEDAGIRHRRMIRPESLTVV